MSRPTVAATWAIDPVYTHGPTIGDPNKATPSVSEADEGFIPQEPIPAEYLNAVLNNVGDWIGYLDSSVGASLLGPGFDGTVVLDGVATVPWATLAGSTYTMTRDCYCGSGGLEVGATTILDTANYRIFSRGKVHVVAGGLIYPVIPTPAGVAGATGGLGGDGHASGSLLKGGIGGHGGNSLAVGQAGTSTVNSIGGAGGAGGASGTPEAGGAGGTVTGSSVVGGDPRLMTAPSLGYIVGILAGAAVIEALSGGAGGGGGGGANGFGAGGAGGGGGIVAIACRELIVEAVGGILAAGGAAGGCTDLAPGGSGGGGGGALILVYGTKSGAGSVFTGAANCPGGTASTSGSGVNGTNGSAGRVFEFDFGDNSTTSPAAGIYKQSGKIIVTTNDSDTLTFAGSFAYAFATGASGYSMKSLIVTRLDGGDPATINLIAKTTTGFTWKTNQPFTGEIDWETEGLV